MRNIFRQFIGTVLLTGLSLIPCAVYSHGFGAMVLELQDDEVVAIVNETPMTVGQLKMLISLRTAPYRQGNYLFFALNDLLETARQAPSYTQLAGQAKAEGITLSDSQHTQLETLVQRYAHRRLYEKHIAEKIENPPMAMLKTIYEEVKEEKFKTSEKFIVRDIYISFGEDTPPEVTDEKIQQAWNDLEGGMPFLTAMENYLPEDASKSARILVPSQDPSISPDLLEVYSSLRNRTYSKPIKTEDSWHIYYLQLHIKEVFIPFESTLSKVTELYEQRSREDKIHAFFASMIQDPELFRLDPGNLENKGDLALNSDVLMIVGGTPLTRQDLIDAGGWFLSQDTRHSKDYLKNIAPRLGPVQRALLDILVEEENIREDSSLQFFQTAAKETFLARNLLLPQINHSEITASNQEILAMYQEMEGYRTGDISIVHYETLSVSSTEIEPDRFNELLAPIDSLESFRKLGDELYSQTQNARYGKKMQALTQSAPLPIFTMLQNKTYTGLSNVSNEHDTLSVYWVETADPLKTPSEKEKQHLGVIIKENKIQDHLESLLSKASEENTVESMMAIP